MLLRLQVKDLVHFCAVGLVLQLQVILQGPEQIDHGVGVQLVLLHGLVDGLERGLLLRVEGAPRAVQDQGSVLLGLFADRHVGAVVGAVVEPAGVDVELVRVVVEDDVDDVLVAPGDLHPVLLVDGDDVLGPLEVAHPGEVHEHDARVDAEFAVVGMTGEAVVPAGVRVLVLGAQGCHLAGVHLPEVVPDDFWRAQENGVGVDVENRVGVVEQRLRK